MICFRKLQIFDWVMSPIKFDCNFSESVVSTQAHHLTEKQKIAEKIYFMNK